MPPSMIEKTPAKDPQPTGTTTAPPSSSSKDLFSPRSAAAVALSAISRQTSEAPPTVGPPARMVSDVKAPIKPHGTPIFPNMFPPSNAGWHQPPWLTPHPAQRFPPAFMALGQGYQPGMPRQSTPLQPALPYEVTSMVTPTPNKKPRLDYDRKTKSLGVLAENFVAKFQHAPRGTPVVVDALAQELGVERRRVYDVVNILEALLMVVKLGKNTYEYLGREHMPRILALLEHHNEVSPPGLIPPGKNGLPKSLSKLTQQFIQCFLQEGGPVLSLNEASDMIHGVATEAELALMFSDTLPTDKKELEAAAQRGLKTKIRRLYDVANVLTAVGLLEKEEPTNRLRRRPQYRWTGPPRADLQKVYAALPGECKDRRSPFELPESSVLANIHQTGGAVWEEPRRVSLPDQI